MMPHEVNAIIAKIVFVLSAATVIMMAKVRAEEIKPVQNITISQEISK